ncbi:hypothetical protein Q8F55_000352 [Vanrija albida]|uniref:NADP-dependent oxidoreductase domain-containing protein n=1 Tax=Vanrija albida TaxID=181172 RepID=A0ABR3QD09_9TREE
MDKGSTARLSLESTRRLASGHTIPLLGFGVYQARGDECRAGVREALRVGYRHVDSAQAYKNEHHVGAALAASGVARADVFLTTKFLPGHSVPAEDDVYAQLLRSLPRLNRSEGRMGDGGGYVDLLLVHAPRPGEAARRVHWAACARAQSEGWARDIGVSNFGVRHLRALPAPTPAVNQIELHPWCQQREIVKYCEERGIAVQAYCPLARADPRRLGDPVLVDVAAKHGKAPTQVLLRWSLQKGYIPLPKSVTPARIKANTELYDFELDAGDMDRLDALDEGAAGACSWNPVDAP